jgi:hypothetical protein
MAGMPLKIIGAGFGRTGTLSTYVALNKLGFPCYHMTEVITNKANRTHVDFWLKVAHFPSGAPHDWEEVFANYTAAVDNPASCVWRELVAAYPDAKVILTLHPKGADAWYESTMSTIYKIGRMWQVTLLGLFVPRLRKFSEMTRKLVWERAHQGEIENRSRALSQYDRQIDAVKAAVPADLLLVFSADQGWEPLCNFLGVDVPTDRFPNVNDRATMQKTLTAVRALGYGVVVVCSFVAVAVIYALVRLLT